MLTTDIDVAIFFATHHLSIEDSLARYSYVGSNGDESTIYVIWNDPREMEELPRDVVLQKQAALRPERQSCVVVRSGPHALNLATEFLLAVIKLEGPGPWHCGQTVGWLFPQSDEDMFLRALKSHKCAATHLTDFGMSAPPTPQFAAPKGSASPAPSFDMTLSRPFFRCVRPGTDGDYTEGGRGRCPAFRLCSRRHALHSRFLASPKRSSALVRIRGTCGRQRGGVLLPMPRTTCSCLR